MKFLADVNIAQSVIRFLRDLNHDVLDAKKEYLQALDTEIIKTAQKENRIILTRDKDFEDLIQLPKFKAAAIVFRLRDQKPDNIILYLDKLLKEEFEETIIKSLITVRDETNDIKSLQFTIEQ